MAKRCVAILFDNRDGNRSYYERTLPSHLMAGVCEVLCKEEQWLGMPEARYAAKHETKWRARHDNYGAHVHDSSNSTKGASSTKL